MKKAASFLVPLAGCLGLVHAVLGSEIHKGCTLSPELDNPPPEEFSLEPLALGVFTVNIETPAGYEFLGAGPAEITGDGFVWMQTAEWEFMVVNTKWQSAQTRVNLTARWKRLGSGGGSGGGGAITRTGVGNAFAQIGELVVFAEPPAVPVGEPARVAAYASDWEGSPAVCDWTVWPAPDAWFVGGSVGVSSVQVQRNTSGEAVVSAVYRENPEKTGEATVTFVAVTGITAQPSVVGVGGDVAYGITTEPPGYGWLVTYVPADVSTPGVKTVTAVCGSSSAQCEVTVVGVKRVICEEYNVVSETDEPDEPETVYTTWTNALDEYVELIAVPEPVVPWPEGWPVWEGAEQDAEDRGKARVSRNVATLSVKDADARASCGTSAKAARVIVARLNLEYDNLPEEWAVPPDEPNEEVPGGFLAVNDNDNAGGANPGQGNATPDNLDSAPLAYPDPDLRPIKLILQPSDMEHGVVTLSVADEGGPLRAWADGKKNATPKTWSLDEGERPPAEVYLEGYAPGVAAVSLSFAHAEKLALADTVNMNVLKVESIDATSPKSGTSANPPPNPPPFAGHTPWPFDVTHSPNPDKHMVVFYKDVVDSSFNVQDFDVTLKANILPTSITADQLSEVWSKISGPASGSLNQTDTFEVKYQNPKVGGVYRFDFDLGLSGCAKSEANVVLPLAGADLDSIVSADIGRANTFATTVRANYTWVERQYPWNGTRWFVANGAGDYLGRPNNGSAPTVWAYNQVDANGFAAVGTWKGKPIRVAKISNFMVGYGARSIGVSSAAAWVSQVIGTWNDSSASKSWDAGWSVGGGASYDTTVTALVADIWDEDNDPNHKNMRLWPNTSATDNYIAPDSFYDPDHQFTSPGFLYMTNP